MEIRDLDPDAARQYVDARSTFVELERTRSNARQVRGGMVWKTVKGTDYLIRTTPAGGQTSLGAKSDTTLAMLEKFTAQKSRIHARLASLREALSRHERMNRALRVGRMPNIAVAVDGSMARMHTIDPRAFVDFKRWMARQADRQAIERQRDELQAETVEWLIRERLPQLTADARP